MLTLQDCIEVAGLTDEEIEVIARHEHLPAIIAVEKAYAFLQEDWGPPAVRQMVIDELDRCVACGDKEKALQALKALDDICRAYPPGHDRRHEHCEPGPPV